MIDRANGLTYAAVAVGGGLGALLRLWMTGADWLGAYGSLLAVNAAGCAMVGLIWPFSVPGRRRVLPEAVSIALMAGLCGALTSFSSVVVLMLGERSASGAPQVLLLSAASVACWLAATLAGLALGGVLNPTAGPEPGPNP